MRGLIFVVSVLLASAAQALDFAQPVLFGVTSTMTVSAMSISNVTPTDVIVSTAPLYRQVCVQNLDTTAFLACGESISVSTQSASSLMGVYLTTATAVSYAVPSDCFEVVPGKRFYCLSASATGTSRAVIIRKR